MNSKLSARKAVGQIFCWYTLSLLCALEDTLTAARAGPCTKIFLAPQIEMFAWGEDTGVRLEL